MPVFDCEPNDEAPRFGEEQWAHYDLPTLCRYQVYCGSPFYTLSSIFLTAKKSIADERLTSTVIHLVLVLFGAHL